MEFVDKSDKDAARKDTESFWCEMTAGQAARMKGIFVRDARLLDPDAPEAQVEAAATIYMLIAKSGGAPEPEKAALLQRERDYRRTLAPVLRTKAYAMIRAVAEYWDQKFPDAPKGKGSA